MTAITSSLPSRFAPLFCILNDIAGLNPVGIAVAGSFGNPKKYPDNNSDLDLLFVFNSENIMEIVREVESITSGHHDLKCLRLGPHPQFGHLLNIFDTKDPLLWVDVGVMDVNYSRCYLTGLPITTLFGDVVNSGLPPDVDAQLEHLYKKIVKSINKGKNDLVINYCFRFYQWANIEPDTTKSIDEHVRYIRQYAIKRFPYFSEIDTSNNLLQGTLR